MTINYTTNLSLAEPVTGTESGTWGDDVNKGLTDYLDIAIAGTLALTSSSFTANALTLANTTGNNTSNGITSTTGQYYILKVSSLTANVTITAPSSSKTYVVVNLDPTYTVTIKASGQTGATIPASSKALVVYNGTDYTQVGASAGGSTTQIQYNNGGALAGSANLTFNGTTLTMGSSTVFAGDFSNATFANRTVFQTSTSNSSTGVYAVPNGTSTAASWQALNNSSPTNASKILIATNGSTDVQLVSGINGTGTYLPLSIYNGGVGTFVFGTSGQFGIGPLASVNYGTSGQVLTSGGASAAPTWSTVTVSGAYTRTAFTATASQTTFSVTYTVGYLQVYINGVLLNASDYTATSGTSVVLAVGANSGDIVEFIAMSISSVGTASSISGGAAGEVVYQTGANTTGFTGVGTTGQVLTSNGTSAPTWSTLSYPSLSSAQTWTATQTFNGSSSTFSAVMLNVAETVNVVGSAPSSTTNFYVQSGSVQYYTTNAANNWTLNIAFSSGTSLNSAMSTGQSMTIAMLATQGSTAYYNSAVTIDGTSVTPYWQGGSAPTKGNASGIDVYTYTVIKTGSATYTVLASQTQF